MDFSMRVWKEQYISKKIKISQYSTQFWFEDDDVSTSLVALEETFYFSSAQTKQKSREMSNFS